jgi:hypothetical protein
MLTHEVNCVLLLYYNLTLLKCNIKNTRFLGLKVCVIEKQAILVLSGPPFNKYITLEENVCMLFSFKVMAVVQYKQSIKAVIFPESLMPNRS